MVGIRNSPAEVSSYLRKVRKPLIEKKRRERMNDSIAQLKSLIADTITNNTAPMTRVDKADILELTVTHLTQLQDQQRAVTMATEVAAYNAGFKDCARHTVNLLSTEKQMDQRSISQLSNNLHTVFLAKSGQPKPSPNTRTMSTPMRARDFNTIFQSSHVPDYSPIQNGGQLPAEVLSFCLGSYQHKMTPNSNISFDSGIHSSRDNSSSFSSDRSMKSISDVSDTSESGVNIDVVSIGEGNDNTVGHVIKDVMWRPW